MVARLGARRWKLLHRLAYVDRDRRRHALLPARQVRRAASRSRSRSSSACCSRYRVVAHYLDLRREVRAARDEARAPRRPRRRSRRKFWSGELEHRADLRRDARRQDVPVRGSRWRPAAVRAHRRPVPQPRARRSTASASTARTRSRRRRRAARYCEISVKRAATATARSTSTTPGARRSASRSPRRPASSSSPATRPSASC